MRARDRITSRGGVAGCPPPITCIGAVRPASGAASLAASVTGAGVSEDAARTTGRPSRWSRCRWIAAGATPTRAATFRMLLSDPPALSASSMAPTSDRAPTEQHGRPP